MIRLTWEWSFFFLPPFLFPLSSSASTTKSILWKLDRISARIAAACRVRWLSVNLFMWIFSSIHLNFSSSLCRILLRFWTWLLGSSRAWCGGGSGGRMYIYDEIQINNFAFYFDFAPLLLLHSHSFCAQMYILSKTQRVLYAPRHIAHILIHSNLFLIHVILNVPPSPPSSVHSWGVRTDENDDFTNASRVLSQRAESFHLGKFIILKYVRE